MFQSFASANARMVRMVHTMVGMLNATMSRVTRYKHKWSPFNHSLDSPHLNMTKDEKNKVIWIDIIKFDNRTWINPTSLGKKMDTMRHTFYTHLEDGFIIGPSYTERCLHNGIL